MDTIRDLEQFLDNFQMDDVKSSHSLMDNLLFYIAIINVRWSRCVRYSCDSWTSSFYRAIFLRVRASRPTKIVTAKTVATSEVAMPGERTVLKGLIGHSNSSGDQAPWECDGGNPVSCAELNTVHRAISNLYF